MIQSVRSLWRRSVPVGVRQSAGRVLYPLAVEAVLARARSNFTSGGDGPPVLVGFFSGTSGIAQSVQLASRALDHLGLGHVKQDVGDLSAPPPPKVRTSSAWLYHLNPPELLTLWRAWDVSHLAGPRFGYWAWELPKAPRLWRRAARVMDGVILPSRYTANAMGPATRSIHVVPHPMFPDDFTGIVRRSPRSSDGAFKVVALFDFKSSVARKNPLAVLAAHQAAFGCDPSAQLCVKTHNSDISPELAKMLRSAAGSNVQFVDGVWDRARVLDFIAQADVLISLHRAEGFGLTMAEAMMVGTPVVATGWSGNLDFMDSETACLVPCSHQRVVDAQGIYRGQIWAEPDVTAAADHLRRLRGDPRFAFDIAARAKARVQRDLSPEAWFSAMPADFRRAFHRDA